VRWRALVPVLGGWDPCRKATRLLEAATGAARADAAADELQAALAHAAAPALPSVTPHGEVTHLSKVPVLPAEEAFAWQTAFRVELL
jgi:hypothetical protein